MSDSKTKSRKGFASMTPERQRELARMGGKSVAPEKRSFSQNRELARMAGRKGGLVGRPRPLEVEAGE